MKGDWGVSHPYRPETDQVEKAQQAAIEQIHLESRLARARPATIDKSAEQPLWKLEQKDAAAYRARVEQFGKDFAGKPGVDEVTGHAMGDNAIYRTGAAHQIAVAYKLGPERVKCFEDPIAHGDKHAVDIVTTDGIAIECKAATGEAISGSSVYKGIRQGEIYLDSGKYRGAIVVCPDGTLQEAGQKAALGRESYTDVRVCELRDLDKALRQTGQLKLSA